MAKKSSESVKVADLFEDETVEMIRTGLYLRKDLHEKLKEASAETGKSINQILNKIIGKFFEG